MKESQMKHPVRLIEAPEAADAQRLDNFLLKSLKGLPKSRLYRLLRKGEIRVNKKRVGPDYRLSAGDMVRLPPLSLDPPAQKPGAPSSNFVATLKERILYEDKDLIIFNKPPHMAVHGGSGIRCGVIEALRQIHPLEKALELAHRLDRDTSGCLIITKKPSILKVLHAALREGTVQKTYWLLVAGYWPAKTKRVDEPLRKNTLQSGERMVRVSSDGKEATTNFRVLKRFEKTTLVAAEPLTGRTHQIRVHAAHVGHPILGDEKYGNEESMRYAKEFSCRRLFLHAEHLRFTLPETDHAPKRVIDIHAPLAEDLESCLKKL